MTNFGLFLSYIVMRMPAKLHIWLVSLSQNGAKMRKTNRPWPKSNQFQMWSGYISMSNFRPLLPWVLKKITEIPNLTCFTKSKWHQNDEYQQTVIKVLSVLKAVRIHQHAKFEAIQSDCNKNSNEESTLSLMPPNTKWKGIIAKKCQKYKIAILAKPGTYVKWTI